MATPPSGPDLSDKEWCRSFIDHRCILRSPERLLIGKNGELNTWQFYMPIALLNQQFQQRIGRLFWERYLDKFRMRPFQVCGIESGGVPLIAAIQNTAYKAGVKVNVFSVKKKAKTYGLLNWFEGMVLDLPVLLVDDIIGSGESMMAAASHLTRQELFPEVFAVVACKKMKLLQGSPFKPVVLYNADDFALSHRGYLTKYNNGLSQHRLPQAT
jgi:orotate phosphoribosyltransferase